MILWHYYAWVVVNSCLSSIPDAARLSPKRRANGQRRKSASSATSRFPAGRSLGLEVAFQASHFAERVGVVPGEICSTSGSYSRMGCNLGCACQFGELCRKKLMLPSADHAYVVDVGICELSSGLVLGSVAAIFFFIIAITFSIGFVTIKAKNENLRGMRSMSASSYWSSDDDDCRPTVPVSLGMVEIGQNKVPVTAEKGIDVKKVLESKPFKEWANSISLERRLHVFKIHIQSVDMLGAKAGFVKFKADTSIDGKRVPGIVCMRGSTPAILVLLHHGDLCFTLVVRQPRVPACFSNMVEIPVGMFDSDGNFAGIAARKLLDRAGIHIRRNELLDMTQMAFKDKYPGVFPSCGGSDESNRIFLYQKSITTEELGHLHRRLIGMAEESEIIKLEMLPFESLWRSSPDAKALASLSLYQRLHAAGLISRSAS